MEKEFTEKHVELAKRLFSNMAPGIPQAEIELDNTANHHDTMQAGAYTLMWDVHPTRGQSLIKVEVFMPSAVGRPFDPPNDGDIIEVGWTDTVERALAMVAGHESVLTALLYMRDLNEVEGN